MFSSKSLIRNFCDELEIKAKKTLSKDIFDHIAGGAGDELTLSRNRSGYSEIALVPQVLQGMEYVDTSASIFGIQCKAPIVIAPTAFHGLVSPEREVGTALAAQDAGCIMSVSMMANTPLEEIATASSSLWFQVHIHSDRLITEELIRRAEHSGYKAIIITVDIPQMGKRYRDIRNGFKLPSSCIPANFIEADKEINLKATEFNPAVTWEDIKWVKSITKLPILLKGILHKDDALKAMDYGANGIIISNHGGRQLDGAIATIEALPGIASIIKGRIPVLIDGGVRSGVDILKAVALGADAVLIGRPVLWGLAVSGKKGVFQVMMTFIQEFALAMRLVGCNSIKEIKSRGKSLIFSCEEYLKAKNMDAFLISNINLFRKEVVDLSAKQDAMLHLLLPQQTFLKAKL